MRSRLTLLLVCTLATATACSSMEPTPQQTTSVPAGPEKPVSVGTVNVDAPTEPTICESPDGWYAQPVPHDGQHATTAIFGTQPGTYLATNATGGISLYSYNSDHPPTVVTDERLYSYRLSSDGKTLVGSLNSELIFIDVESGDTTPTAVLADGIIDWSPTSQSVFFVGKTNEGVRGIGEYNLNSMSTTWWLSQGHGNELADRLFDWIHADGSLSPDGNQMLLASGYSETSTVFGFDLQNGDLLEYTGTYGYGVSPVWNPSGKYAYMGVGAGYTLDIDSREVKRMEFPFRVVRVLDVSPNDTLLVHGKGNRGDCWYVGPEPTAR